MSQLPAVPEAAGFDWAQIIALIMQLIIILFPQPTPTPTVPAGAGPEAPLDHAWRCRQTLLAALQTAQDAAQHMQDSRRHPHGGGPGKAVPGA